VSFKPHRESAEAARTAAVAANLPNVRARELRSADAYDALAVRDENIAARAETREAEAAARKVINDADDEQEGE
jgi:hypothetical protein